MKKMKSKTLVVTDAVTAVSRKSRSPKKQLQKHTAMDVVQAIQVVVAASVAAYRIAQPFIQKIRRKGK